MQMGIVSLGVDGPDIARFFGVLDGPPVFVEELVIAAVLRVMSFFFEDTKKRLGAFEGRFILRRPIISDQSVQGEGVQVDVLARVDGPAVVADFGEIAAVLRIAHVFFEKLKAGLGGRERGFLFDSLLREGAEKPKLPALHGQELLPRRGELSVLQGFQIAAVSPIHAIGQIERDDALIQDAPAARSLSVQLFRGGGGFVSPRGIDPGARRQQRDAGKQCPGYFDRTNHGALSLPR